MSFMAHRVLKAFDGYLPGKRIFPNKVMHRSTLLALVASGHLILEKEYGAAQAKAVKVKAAPQVEAAAVDYKPTRRGRPARVERVTKEEGES